MNIIQRIIGHIKYRHIKNRNMRMFAMIANSTTPLDAKEAAILLDKVSAYHPNNK